MTRRGEGKQRLTSVVRRTLDPEETLRGQGRAAATHDAAVEAQVTGHRCRVDGLLYSETALQGAQGRVRSRIEALVNSGGEFGVEGRSETLVEYCT